MNRILARDPEIDTFPIYYQQLKGLSHYPAPEKHCFPFHFIYPNAYCHIKALYVYSWRGLWHHFGRNSNGLLLILSRCCCVASVFQYENSP